MPGLPMMPPEEKGPYYSDATLSGGFLELSGEVRADEESEASAVLRQVHRLANKAENDIDRYRIERLAQLRAELDRVEGAENVKVS